VGEDGQALNYPAPRKLDLEEITEIVNDFRLAARNAIDAGKLGVQKTNLVSLCFEILSDIKQ
jgi:2,4-dienoyl-CoA reductase-like NADH-dependent reductase (Old Yellow Enzyme family)